MSFDYINGPLFYQDASKDCKPLCVVSNVSGYYYDRWHPLLPNHIEPQVAPPDWQKYLQNPLKPKPFVPTYPADVLKEFLPQSPPPKQITDEEVAEFKRLLEKARKWDEEHGEPHCEQDEKINDLKTMGDILGVNLDFIAE